ncbi:hypothetical protein pdam_00009737 [Pocillopora damicornis]|uniref:DUF6570 domain-containing protein n=1 Tax=Pocillopora damicornis TaxID=46731 RepID=A0A3M6TPB3_POCDA|nr:hypothetical protein pdam_00009737 [Pocillopora damicornis]
MAHQYKLWILIESRVVKQKSIRMQNNGCCYKTRKHSKKSVLKLNRTSYPSQDIFNILLSFDGKECICKTCHSKVNQGSLPCQATVHNLPEFIMSALNWLKVSNPLYKDIQIDCSNISEELTDMTQADNE